MVHVASLQGGITAEELGVGLCKIQTYIVGQEVDGGKTGVGQRRKEWLSSEHARARVCACTGVVMWAAQRALHQMLVYPQ